MDKPQEVCSNVREVIDLEDDDDCSLLTNDRKKKHSTKCLNLGCVSGEDLAQPSNFVLTYFGMKRTKDQLVCAKCFAKVEFHHQKLAEFLRKGESLFMCDFPEKKDVILLDSDEEDVPDEAGVLSADVHFTIQNNLDDLISNACHKFDIEFQINEATNFLSNKTEYMLESCEKIGSSLDSLQKSVDGMRKMIYDEYRQPLKELEELQLTDCEIPPDGESLFGERRHRMPHPKWPMGTQGWAPTKKVTQLGSRSFSEAVNSDVVALKDEAGVPPKDLPEAGPLVRPKLKINDLVYVMKVSFFSTWLLARVVDINTKTDGDVTNNTYRIRLEQPSQRKASPLKNVIGRYLAYPDVSPVLLPVGTRVIAIFKEEGQPINKENYYSGIIAEPPKNMNKYRYLIFFDDGYAQYVPHENIRLVCECSDNVWEDIHPEPRDFIRNYLQQFPERPMVKLQRGQIVKTEWNGRWWIVRVLEVDGSLVKVHFDADSRTEWIYRGSTRLGPLYQEIAAARDRQQSGTLARSRGFGAAKQNNLPYVEYTRTDDDSKRDDDSPEFIPTRSVAKKSTSKKTENVITNADVPKPLVPQIPEGKIEEKLLVNPLEPIRFRVHNCSTHCVSWTDYTPSQHKGVNPLAIPLLHAFQRLICRFKNKRVVTYVAPCGRRLRTHEELHKYLRMTKSLLTVDMFDFDFWVSCTDEFFVEKSFTHIEDLSYGKENIPISCVNDLDHNMPPYVQYMTERQPADGVNLNLDKNFLVGCDCEDDCSDPLKCSCVQLTNAGAKYCSFGQAGDPIFGYQYRRLQERVITGIYECNPQCKCASTCLNRVAQQPLSSRLQLFKTPKKGWGIRTLCDIPRGAFICIYAGFLLTEQAANEGGKNYGDEYLAELDYIEVVERLKEDYESDVPRDLLEDSDDSKDSSLSDTENTEEEAGPDFDSQDSFNKPDSDEEFVTSWRNDARNAEDIRTRLRKRNQRLTSTEETDNEKESKETRKNKRFEQDTISISDEDTSSSFDTNIPFGTNCGECGLPFANPKDRIRCSGSCDKTYHTGCCSVKTMERWSKMGSKRSSWMCTECKLEYQAQRKPSHFNANVLDQEEYVPKYTSVRDMYGEDESVYIMDAKTNGNIGRYLNHSCNPNVFVQNVFVDTHDVRFPWVAFFSLNYIRAGAELTWDYNYDVGSVPGKILHCYCGSTNCRGRLL